MAKKRYPLYKSSRERDLCRVMERIGEVDNKLASRCAYYPIFRFSMWEDEVTGEIKQGQVFICKSCSRESPNSRCAHSHILTDF